MKHLWKVIAVAAIALTSFFGGTLYAVKNYHQGVTEGFLVMSDLVRSNRVFEVSQLINLYKQSEQSPDEAKEFMKRMILMKFTEEGRFKGVFGERVGGEDGLLLANLEIEEFISEYPLKECETEPKETQLECNLKHILPEG